MDVVRIFIDKFPVAHDRQMNRLWLENVQICGKESVSRLAFLRVTYESILSQMRVE